MLELDEKNICITVVGRTGAGKTTWISTLLKDGKKLQAICNGNQANKDGQTKIITEYELCDPELCDTVMVKSLTLDKEGYENLKEEEKNEFQKQLGKYVGNTKPTDGNVKGTLLLDFGDKVDVGHFFEDVVNNVVLQNMGIVQKIQIRAGADRQIWDTIKEMGLEKVTINDTRGLMDDKLMIRKYMKGKDLNDETGEKKAGRKNAHIGERLMRDRGFQEADGCIYLSKGVEGVEGDFGEMYEDVFRAVATSMPTIVVARENLLTEKLADLDKEERKNAYNKWMDKENVNDKGDFGKPLQRAKGHKEIRDLLNANGLFNTEDVFAWARQKHYRQLLLPDVVEALGDSKQVVSKETFSEDTEIYKMIVWEIFRISLGEIYEYKRDLACFMKNLKESESKIKDFYYHKVNEMLQKSIVPDVNQQWDIGRLSRVYPGTVANLFLNYDSVYGGLLGPQGGITPIGERKAAVGLMESALWLYNDIEREFLADWKKNSETDEERAYLIMITEFLERLKKQNLDCRSTPPVMFDADLLDNVFETIKAQQQNNDCVYPDIKAKFGEEVSVVCSALYLIISNVLWDTSVQIENCSK